MAKSPCFRPLTRNCLAFRGSTGRVSPDPETWGPKMSGSPGQISLDLDIRHSGPPSPGQVQLGPATTVLLFCPPFPVELHSQETPPAELLSQLEQAEPTEAQPTGPAPAPAEVPRVEPEPAPPAASCPALGPQPESMAAPSPAAVLGHPVAARRSVSPPEPCLGPAPGPLPLFPSLTVALVLVFTIALISWIYINNRTSF
ncbi:anther-specific proline-rich protein APG-like [Heterocephalus glaber]|uniref:Anther-specific proline-rich protein APG-like n=1 Tax=Heterocephalus glaber TaxID=10181 RepID=A0AAX6T175_HETGA|nr:anther-specific proline-rich protein APG-like [Heterocephalus glaber]